MFIEQAVPALTRVVNGQVEHARMDLVFDQNGNTTYLDVSIIAPFSSNPALVATASTRPGHMAKRAERTKFERYSRINLVPFILETTGRPGHHAKKCISNLMKDADNPKLAIRDTWSAMQSVLQRWPTYLDHARGKGLTFQVSLCVGGTCGYTVSTEVMLTSTAPALPALPALSDYSLHPRHT